MTTSPRPKERPILFSAPMVRAILEGRKTVTRRAVKPQPPEGHKWCGWIVDSTCTKEIGAASWGESSGPLQRSSVYARCPYGKPGDRLWVREAWARVGIAQAPDQEWVVYRESDNRTDYGGPWKPGIHMFRRDSRILLEITGVRVERLQDISEEQALAEGIAKTQDGGYHVEDGKHYFASPIDSFASLWSSVGGDWEANPWVWCVSFKWVTP